VALEANTIPTSKNVRMGNALQPGVDEHPAVGAGRDSRVQEHRTRSDTCGYECDVEGNRPLIVQRDHPPLDRLHHLALNDLDVPATQGFQGKPPHLVGRTRHQPFAGDEDDPPIHPLSEGAAKDSLKSPPRPHRRR
jgi:hypothetical protein